MSARVVTIDTHYLDRPEFAAAYLLVEDGRAAFIDNNTAHAVPRLLAALEAEALTPEQVDWIIITHVHLDHAGGTSRLLSSCPNATVLAHPRAARHVIDPSKLVASASAVYGAERFEQLYGVIEPVDAARVRVMEDGETVTLGEGRELGFMHTRGHANHHFCVTDAASRSLFTGDAFGLLYPALQGPGTFAVPSTSPTDFDAELARGSIERLVAWGPDTVYPTHFGPVTDIEVAAGQLTRHLDFAERLLEDADASGLPDADLTAYCHQRLRDYFSGLLDHHGALGRDAATWALLETDIDLNAQGVAWVAQKRRHERAGA